ncbi:hypothetical protein IEQ34_017014 [Dendrobium chrysotoxum]|uniref:Uncharacterized protein n=1 Tax=Dendrobium chrysotoxum TaxID=161865 RepID=A0AAV7GH46_DENCH|nr:hypothetical protein IEQ34_017014 [Dendrobium chrysotoxum]
MEVFPNFCVHSKCIGHLRDACHLLSSVLKNVHNNANSLNNSDGNVTVAKGNLFNVTISTLTPTLHVNDLVVDDVNVVTDLPAVALIGGNGDQLSSSAEENGVSVHYGLVPVVGEDPSDVGPIVGVDPSITVKHVSNNCVREEGFREYTGTNICLFNVRASPISSTRTDVRNEVVALVNSGGNSVSLEPMDVLVSNMPVESDYSVVASVGLPCNLRVNEDMSFVNVSIELISSDELKAKLSLNLIETRVDQSNWLNRSDTDAVEPERTSGQFFQHLRQYWLRGKKHGNSYLISEAHFLPKGNLYDIAISFDGEERAKMIVAIDNKIVSVLNIKDKLEGTTELYLNNAQYLSDRLVIIFNWNLSGETKFFRFYTKPLPRKTATGSNSYNNGDNEELDFVEEEFEGEWYICRLNAYVVE